MSDQISLQRLLNETQDPAQLFLKLSKQGFNGLPDTELSSKPFSQSVSVYNGKVRQCIRTGNNLYLLHTDRLSAFDRFVASIPLKGSLLASIARYWHIKTKEFMPTAFISQPHERILLQKNLKPVKAEFIVRGYLAGSMLRSYQKGERSFCGCTLPEGIPAFGKLPEPILTPTSKAELGEHDENRTPEQLINEGILSPKEWDYLKQKSLELFEHGTNIYRDNGWILVDTKYEFGKDPQGTLMVMDEIHTPDSSRLWKKETYENNLNHGHEPDMFDKEIVRKYLLSQGFSGNGSIPPVPSSLMISLLRSYAKIATDLCDMLPTGQKLNAKVFSRILSENQS